MDRMQRRCDLQILRMKLFPYIPYRRIGDRQVEALDKSFGKAAMESGSEGFHGCNENIDVWSLIGKGG